MTQEEKQLLFKDLCARLPYGVIMTNKMLTETYYPLDGIEWQHAYFDNDWDDVPYLRPMSSMTEEEKEELKSFYDAENVTNESICFLEGGTLEEYEAEIPFIFCYNIVVWLLEHHFDYRGLIPLGLAIEVTEDNNPYKR